MSGRKRFLSLVLCAIMALSPFATIGASANGLVSTANYISSTDTNTPATDTDVSLFGTLALKAPVVVDTLEQYYTITPEESDYYIFNSYQESEQNADPYLYVYDSRWNCIVDDDDGADDRENNFRGIQWLEAGETYYVCFTHWQGGYNSGEEYTALVEKNPVASIEIALGSFEFVLNTGGWWYYNEETDQEFFYYDVDRVFDEVVLKVNYNDGRPSEFIECGENGYVLYDHDQSESPWTVGGNNTITIEYMGKTCTTNAKIIENPVASIEFVSCDYTYYEQDNGYWGWSEELEENFFYYNAWTAVQNAKIRVNYNNGKPSEIIEYYDDKGYETGFGYSEKQHSSPWTVGGTNNTITLTYMDKECTFNAVVLLNPVQSIEFVSCDFEYLEENEEYGDWTENNNGEYFEYYEYHAVQSAKIKVNYNDGRPSKVIGNWDDNGYSVFGYSSNQYGNPWTVGGENTITITYMGKSCTFSATVVEPIDPTSIESIEFVSCDFEYVENYYGRQNGEDYWYDPEYALQNAKIKLNYFAETGKEPDIVRYSKLEGIDYSHNQYSNPWTVGGENNTITIEYMGKECSFNAVVKPNPVESIEFVSCNFQYTENHPNQGYYDLDDDEERFFRYDPLCAVEKTTIKVNYTDKSQPDIIGFYNDETEEENFNFYASQWSNHWTVGGTNNTITIEYMGQVCSFNATVVAGPFNDNNFDISINEEEKEASIYYIGENQEHAIVPANVGEYTVTGIGSNAYSNNTKLNTVYIPKTVTYIGADAFAGCTGLVNVYYGGSEEEWNAITIRSGNVYLKVAQKRFFSNAYGGCTHPSTYPVVVANATCGANGTINNVCTNCGVAISTTPIAATGAHNYVTTVTKGTFKKDGGKVTACTVCGHEAENTAYKKAVVKLSATTFEYNGKVRKPKVTVKTSNGKTISSKDYTVKFSNSKSKKYGTYKVTVTFKNNSKYSGKTTVTYSITSKKTSISSLKAGKKAFTVKYKKQTTAKGYEIQYSLKKDFKSAKTVKISKNSTVSKTVKKLKAKKTYYVRVRTVRGKVKSAWSSAKKVKTK